MIEDGLQEWIAGEIRRQCPPGIPPLIVRWQPYEEVDKLVRIRRIAPDFEQGLFHIADAPTAGDNDLLVEQIVGLDNTLVADDGPDSLEMGRRWLAGRQRKQAGNMVVGGRCASRPVCQATGLPGAV